MNTHTRSTSPKVDQVEPASGPVARIIAASVATALAAAATLVAVVFPGATEATIIGAFLVAFGLGWALLGWATTRFTNRPLDWTRVPAFAMTATGLALLVLAPQDAAMRTMSWVWPLPTIALAVSIWVRARRTVPRRGRWMLTAIAGVLAVAAVGATYENISVVRDHHTYAAPGETYDVNGHQLYLDCRGHGGPTVVLFNGMGEVSVSWARIVDHTNTQARVCTYDRAGQGWSGDVDQPQDGITAAQDVHTLLQEAGEHGPFVLVGHSIGGTFALTYAAQYPHQVAGMVLLAVLPFLYRLGLGRLVYAVQPPHLPQPAGDVATSLTATARGARNGRDEVAMLPDVFAQAQALTTLHRLPLAVLTARESLDGTDGWAKAQDRLAALSTNTVHQVVDSTHSGLLEDPGPAKQSATAIIRVVNAVRTATHLAR
jgi:pimeloyl-ACP methyl ester carboxylesterase